MSANAALVLLNFPANVSLNFSPLTCADEIIERANQRSRAMEGDGGVHESDDGTYIVQGDIAMTKEQYEEYMAEWKKQEAELIAKGEMKPDK